MNIPGNGNFGTLEVQQSFVQIPSEGPPTLATAAQQTGALSANASDQEIIPLDSLSQVLHCLHLFYTFNLCYDFYVYS